MNFLSSNFLDQVYFGNSVLDYLIVIGALVLGFLVVKFLAHRISNFIFKIVVRKAENVDRESLFKLLSAPLRWLIMLVVLFVCTNHLEFPKEWELASKNEFGLRMLLSRSYLTFLCIVVTWIGLRFVSFIGLLMMARAELTDSKTDDQLVPFVTEILRIVVIIFGIFFMLGTVFRIDIAALVAGLGIGGLALALAAKESLENLLASFMIFFDKPFVIGDLVTVSGQTGTVEKIGFRSTRIRTLEKSYLTIPNLQMVNNVLDNLSMRTFTRVKFDLTLSYQTTEEQIKNIVTEVSSYLMSHTKTNQDAQVRFLEFSTSSLDILVLYFIDSTDYSECLKIREEINFEVMRIVKKNGAIFAFPTQSIYIEKN